MGRGKWRGWGGCGVVGPPQGVGVPGGGISFMCRSVGGLGWLRGWGSCGTGCSWGGGWRRGVGEVAPGWHWWGAQGGSGAALDRGGGGGGQTVAGVSRAGGTG